MDAEIRRMKYWTFFSMALTLFAIGVISMSALLSNRAANKAAETTKINSKILSLIEEGCSVRGDCGSTVNGQPQTIALVNYIIDTLNCVLLIPPTERTPDKIAYCKAITAPKRG